LKSGFLLREITYKQGSSFAVADKLTPVASTLWFEGKLTPLPSSPVPRDYAQTRADPLCDPAKSTGLEQVY
jgi:hypothetical protein